jgi:hypothetical protein
VITKEAKTIAAEWIASNWEQFPGFAGSFFGGSINVTPEEAPWPESSDVDITVLADVPRGLSHVHHQDLLLEISTQPRDKFDLSFEGIVSDFRQAIHFSVPSIIMDPTGRLEQVHRQVREAYPRRKWVIKRCQGTEKLVRDVLDGALVTIGFGMDTAWGAVYTLHYAVFAAAEMLALADLRNPTIRKSLVVSRQVLEKCDRLDLQESFLRALGADALSPDTVRAHIEQLERTMVEASAAIRTPFFFSDKLQAGSRSHILAGAQEIVNTGLHREAALWIQLILAIAQRAIETDAPPSTRASYQEAYWAILDDLGLRTPAQVAEHIQIIRDLLPQIRQAIEETMRRNPAIVE